MLLFNVHTFDVNIYTAKSYCFKVVSTPTLKLMWSLNTHTYVYIHLKSVQTETHLIHSAYNVSQESFIQKWTMYIYHITVVIGTYVHYVITRHHLYDLNVVMNSTQSN